MIADSVRGSIVNVSSQASLSGLLDHTVYAATKGAMDAASRVMAVELGERRCGRWWVGQQRAPWTTHPEFGS